MQRLQKEEHFTFAPKDSPFVIDSWDMQKPEHSYSIDTRDTSQSIRCHNKKKVPFPSTTTTYPQLLLLACVMCTNVINFANVRPDVVSWEAPVVRSWYCPLVSTKHLTFVSKIQLLPSPRRLCCHRVICRPFSGFMNKPHSMQFNISDLDGKKRKSSVKF